MRISELIAQLQDAQCRLGDVPVSLCIADTDGYPCYRAPSYLATRLLWNEGVWHSDYAAFAGPPQTMLVIDTA